MRIVISSGHGKYIRGASGSPVPPQLDEVDEARRVVEKIAEYWRASGVEVQTFHDNTSHDQNTNLNTIVNYHNSHLQPHDLDVSIHFNAYDGSAHGTECLYVTQESLARKVADAVAAVGFTNRGPKERTDLFFLNNTDEPAILVETCFCDNTNDSNLYRSRFDDVCRAIAGAISGEQAQPSPPDRPSRPEPVPPEPGPGERTISKGDQGRDVVSLQQSLGLPADGIFGEVTETQVEAFQAAAGLSADGIVGPGTWDEINELDQRVADGGNGVTNQEIEQIVELAKRSPLMNYSWRDRGQAPRGYIPGMALCFARALRDKDSGAVQTMAMEDSQSPNYDALTWYRNEFLALGMLNNKSGPDTLRHLFVLMIGLGMRESSGKYCEGRDLSADNVQSDTAEAGLMQTSWNIRNADSEIPPLLKEFWDNPNGFREEAFAEGISPTANNLSCYGKGDGARYQWLARYAPAFTVMVTGVGLRTLRQHWGPINRKEAELKREADELLKRVQELLASGGAVA